MFRVETLIILLRLIVYNGIAKAKNNKNVWTDRKNRNCSFKHHPFYIPIAYSYSVRTEQIEIFSYLCVSIKRI